MTDEEIEKLAESIAHKLSGELYRIPDVFWDGLEADYTTYMLAPISIPSANRYCPFILGVKINQTTHLIEFRLTDINNRIIKEWTIG
jgi:hypothetical protein